MQKHKIVYKKTNELIPYARNSRTHSDEQVGQIAASIREFGFTNPVLIDGDNGIIAGHGRIMAASRLKLDEVPCIVLDYLTDAQKKAYVIADNKLALNAGWDDELLSLELSELESLDFDLSLLGFSDDELSSLMDLDASTGDGLTDEDAVPEVQESPVSVLGDIWLLGGHRLMCGDSTCLNSVSKLLNGKSVDLIFTDPPYNVAFDGRGGKHEVIKNDKLPEAEFNKFIAEVVSVIHSVKPKAYYIWCNWKFYSVLQNLLDFKCCIVWAKNVFGMGIGYRHQHEFCLFNGDIDQHIKNESDLWEVKKDTGYVHPTQKPVQLSVRAFSNHIKLKNVLDLFGGSGSTLIGCEQTGRTGFIMELDPKYVDVIVTRWQDYTGKQAIHEATGKTYAEIAANAGKVEAA